MKYYIVAVPLFNAKMEVEAYIMKYQDIAKIFGLSDSYMNMDGIMHSPGLDILNSIGVEPFTGGKPIFIDLNLFGLLADVFHSSKVPPEKVVYVFSKDLPMEQMYLDKCREVKRSRFSIAISKIDLSDETAEIYNLADYLIIDSLENGFESKLKDIRHKYPGKKIVLSDLADINVYEKLKQTDNALFEGRFYTQPLTKGVSTVSPLKANALHLLKIINEEDFELEDVSKIIQQDTALAISLLKFINSPAIGITSKINSIKNAVALLGQKETRKWITMAVSAYISADKPNEITKLSLTRAKFAERLATSFEMGIHAPTLFLMGLFSMLDVILEKPMDKALKEISVNENIRRALVNRDGPFEKVLNLIYSYEMADWNSLQYITLTNNINSENISKAFVESLIWYKQLLESIQ